MSEQQINDRRNWKAQTFPYDYFIPDDSQECSYCLTDKQAEILRGIIEPLGWKTRWWSDTDTPIGKDEIEAFRDDLIRRLMMSCCGDEIPVQYRYTEDGFLQRSEDGGATWTDAPEYDPRNNSPQFPPVPGDDGDDKKCLAATGAVALIKAQVGDQLTDDMSRYTLGQLISDWTNTLINSGGNIFQALVTVATNQIFALVIATLRPALTDPVYDTLQCIIYCNMDDDATINDSQWQAIRDQITSQIGGIAGVFLEHLVYLLGAGGMTNLVRAGGAAEGDCSGCDCNESCNYEWSLFDDFIGIGQTITPGDGYIEIESAFGSGSYWVIIKTDDIDHGCHVSLADIVVSGATVNHGYSDVGYSYTEYAPQYNPALGYGDCCNHIYMYSTAPFTVRFTMTDCP